MNIGLTRERSGERNRFERILLSLESLQGPDDGQSLIEFAVTLPVLLMVVTGMLIFGIAINNYLQLTDATNVGARALSMSRGASDPCQVVYNAVTAAAPTLKASGTSALSFSTSINGGTAYTTSSCTGASSALSNAQGGYITVLVTYPCNLKFYNFNKFTSCTLSAQTTEMVQ